MDSALAAFLIVYYIAVLLYIAAGFIGLYTEDSPSRFLCQMSMLAFLPVLGFLVLACTKLFARRRGARIHDFEPEIRYIGTRSDILYKSDFDKEKNIVPIEEALLLNENHIKRGLLIEALKMDFFESIYFIKKAIKDKDTETSHYAAAALMELKSQLTKELQQAAVQYDKSKGSGEALKAYANALKRYLDSDIGDEGSRRLYQSEYLQVLEKINAQYPDQQSYTVDFINGLIANHEYARAESACADYLDRAGNTEVPYLLFLKLYYKLGSREKMDQMLGRLRSADVSLSESAMNVVRFWMSKEEANG